jgi:hypothetical protein
MMILAILPKKKGDLGGLDLPRLICEGMHYLPLKRRIRTGMLPLSVECATFCGQVRLAQLLPGTAVARTSLAHNRVLGRRASVGGHHHPWPHPQGV